MTQTNPANLDPPPPTTNSVNLEEPDARTVALARRQEYLYGFKASDLPQELLDQVEAAGEETRKLAYVRCVGWSNSGAGGGELNPPPFVWMLYLAQRRGRLNVD